MEKNQEEIQLFSTTNEYEINQVCTILEENNIPYIRNDYGSGSYMNLYMGQSIQGKAIFVHKSDYDKSLELISYFIPNNVDEEIEPELVEETEDDSSQNKYKTIKHSLGFLILGIPVLIMLILLIVTLLNN